MLSLPTLCAKLYEPRESPHLFFCVTYIFCCFSLLSVDPSWPRSRRDTGSGWGPGFEAGFKHGSCYGVEEVDVEVVYVCVLRRGSHLKTQLWLLLPWTSLRRGGGWIGEWGDESFPGSSRQEWWRPVSATVKNVGEGEDWWGKLCRYEEAGKEKLGKCTLIFDWGKRRVLDVVEFLLGPKIR